MTVVTPHSLGYKNCLQAWSDRMRLLSSIFSQHGLSYKIPIHFQHSWHKRHFSLLQNAPTFSITAHTRTCPFVRNAHVVFKNCTYKGTSLLQSTCWFQQDLHPSVFIKHLHYRMPICFWSSLMKLIIFSYEMQLRQNRDELTWLMKSFLHMAMAQNYQPPKWMVFHLVP